MKAGTAAQRKRAAEWQAKSGIGAMPNFSAAVSAQRHESRNSLDDFPTPPWGGRAWAELVVGAEELKGKTCWEPAANRGYLVHGLRDYFGHIAGSDVFDYGFGFPVFDFLSTRDALLRAELPIDFTPDWIVSNPPFNKLLDFVLIALDLARVGVAMFCRTQCLEGGDRYESVYLPHRDRWCFSQFVERISLVRGTVDPEASRPAAYGWLTIWKVPMPPEFLLGRRHIPPCRQRLERAGDYAVGKKHGNFELSAG
jgi:hypothetical protein